MSKAKNKALDLRAYLWIRRFRVCLIIMIATYKKKTLSGLVLQASFIILLCFCQSIDVFASQLVDRSPLKGKFTQKWKLPHDLLTLQALSFLFNRNVLSRAQSVLLDSDHFLYPEFLMLPSGSRYRRPKMKSNRYKYLFVPCAIRLLNGL